MNAEFSRRDAEVLRELGLPCEVCLVDRALVAFVPGRNAPGAKLIALKAKDFVEADAEVRGLGYEPVWS